MELTVDDLPRVYEAVYSARSKWFNIGLRLVHVGTLDSIEREKGDDGDHLRSMLKCWLKGDKRTWKALSDALRSHTVGEDHVARNLDVIAAQSQTHQLPSDSLTIGEDQLARNLDVTAAQSQTHQLPSKPKEITPNLSPDKAISEAELHINELEEKYTTLVTKSQEVVLRKAPSIEEFRTRITLLPKRIKPEQQRYLKDHLSHIYKAKSIDEIFGYLNLQVWDYLNFGLLERIVAVYGDPTIEEMMKEYTESVQSFRKHTSLDVFLKAQPEERCPEISSSLKEQLQEVKFKHRRLSLSSSLDEVESIRRDLAREFCLPDFIVILARIQPGSISITWILPISLTTILKTRIENHSFRFIQRNDVVEVSIAGTTVYLLGVPPEQLTSPGYPEEQAPSPGDPQAPPPQASYPPPQEQPSYPPQPGYLTQSEQPGYPQPQQPQQPGYPAQQLYPQQQAYPLQEAPPPYYPQQPPAPQIGAQLHPYVVIVQPQVITPQVRHYGGRDQGMTLAIISTILAVCCGCWLSLSCSIPAIAFASDAQSAAARGEEAVARQNKNYSITCSVVGLVTGVVFYLGLILAIVAIIMSQTGSSSMSRMN